MPPKKKPAKIPMAPVPSPLNDTICAIAAIDSALDLVRSLWMSAKTDEEKLKAKTQINDFLDKRWPLMQRRDELTEAKAA